MDKSTVNVTKTYIDCVLNRKPNPILEGKSIKLDKDFYLLQLKRGLYIFEYRPYSWEPTISDLQKIERKLFELVKNAPLSIMKYDKVANVYIREEGVAMGLSFSSKLSLDDIKSAGYTGAFDVKDYQ